MASGSCRLRDVYSRHEACWSGERRERGAVDELVAVASAEAIVGSRQRVFCSP